MRETPAAFRRRTRRRYRPPAWLPAGSGLGPEEPCPTLFRYPGPCGLSDYYAGRLRHLGPVAGGELWMAERPLHADVGGARHFGTLAVLQPLRFDACRSTRPGVWVGVNRRVDPALLAWLPPSAFDMPGSWDAVRDAAQARRRLDPRDERRRIEEALQAYLEELQGMRDAGAPATLRPWCELPPAQRLRLLARFGVAPRWTRHRAPAGRLAAAV